jgi:hypothetical protein
MMVYSLWQVVLYLLGWKDQVMADTSQKLSITYSSGLIPPPEWMSTLAVFYDEVWLPFPYDLDFEHHKKYPLYYNLNKMMAYRGYFTSIEYLPSAQKCYFEWKNEWNALFDNSILRNIDIRKFSHHKMSIINIARSLVKERGAELEAITLEPFNAIVEQEPDWAKDVMNEIMDSDREMVLGDLEEYALKLHAIFQRELHYHPIPELFISDLSDTRTSHLAASLVHSLFQYKIPKLQILNAEQILEVRDYLKDTKEGFTYYINQMTDDVEQRIRSGNLSDMEAAQRTLERKILPLYEEFRRQLAAKKTGYWANVLSTTADFFKVVVTPWTLKSYGELFKSLGVALNLTAKDEEALRTNQSQAFQYIATLEKKVSRT